MDWVHCNSCYHTPNQDGDRTFFVTSCGHIACSKCVKKNQNTATPSVSEICRNCKIRCTFSEINRSLDSNSKIFFSSPKDLANQYMTSLKKVLEFQNYHRSRYNKYQAEKLNYLNKFAKAAQSEIKKRSETEKKLAMEREKLRAHCKEKAQKVQSLEDQLTRCKEELLILTSKFKEDRRSSRERDRSITPKRSQYNQFPHLNGDTPITTLSMACTTSTPIDAEPCYPTLSPVFQESPVISCGGDFLTTPALLGIPKLSTQKRSCSVQRDDDSLNFFKM